MTYSNIKTILLDLNSKYTASNVIVYENTLDFTCLQFRLVNNSYYYTIPENAEIIIFVDDVQIDATRIKLVNRFKGIFQFILDSSIFKNGKNKQYEITIDLYQADTDDSCGKSILTELKTSIMYSSGSDDFEQSILNDICPGTTINKPTNPNPHFEFEKIKDDAILDSTITIEY